MSSHSELSYEQRRRLQNKLAQRRFRDRARNRQISSNEPDLEHKQEKGENKGDGKGKGENDGAVHSDMMTEDVALDGMFASNSLDWSLVPTPRLQLPRAEPSSSMEYYSHRQSSSSEASKAVSLVPPCSSFPSNALTLATLQASFFYYVMHSSVKTNPLLMPCMHFAKAIYENSIRLGVEFSVMADTDGISYVSDSWAIHQRQPTNQLSQNGDAAFQLDQGSHHFDSQNLPARRRTLHWNRVPENMHPTLLQLSVEHHPWIDVGFVWPSMRDRILCLLDTVLDDEELCRDSILPGLAGSAIQEPAFHLWGDDPMDEEAWEVSEHFAQKWWILLDEKILRRTNWWRRQRGLLPIKRPSQSVA